MPGFLGSAIRNSFGKGIKLKALALEGTVKPSYQELKARGKAKIGYECKYPILYRMRGHLTANYVTFGSNNINNCSFFSSY